MVTRAGMRRVAVRRIRTHLGRFLAILLIAALGTGFFAGLKVCKRTMAGTLQEFTVATRFHDFEVASTLGFEGEDVRVLGKVAGIRSAEGSRSRDLILSTSGRLGAYRVSQIGRKTDLPSLKAGRMPRSAGEALGDSRAFSEKDLGKTISIAAGNEKTSKEAFTRTSFTLVELCESPAWLGSQRGITDIGDGSLKGFLLVPAAAFQKDQPYTSILLRMKAQPLVYSEDYQALAKKVKKQVRKTAEEQASSRWRKMLAEVREKSPLTYLVSPEDILKMRGLSEPEVYVLGRAENAGYRAFENDTGLVAGIAALFPLLFILVAMLVCMTTVSRLVEEERIQIGTLKALGYSEASITGGYLAYAGLAGVLGWAAGFFAGTLFFPRLLWWAYSVVYDFLPLRYYFSLPLALLTLGAVLGLLLLVTWLTCRETLRQTPAALLVPPAPKAGRRILLERIGPLWRRFSFLQKVTLRNMFRYKKRFLMMLVGIACCSGLILMAFGIRDSMVGVGDIQFGRIQKYDLRVGTGEGQAETVAKEAKAVLPGFRALAAVSQTGKLRKKDGSRLDQVDFLAFPGASEKEFRTCWNLKTPDGKALSLPEKGQVLICEKAAQEAGVRKGGRITLWSGGTKRTFRVAGIFRNYVGTIVIFSGGDGAYLRARGETDCLFAFVRGDRGEAASKLMALPGVRSCSRTDQARRDTDQATESLNSIIWVIVAFAALLAFVVIFDLTGINLAERKREIATVMVLGFTDRETARYALRENLILSVFGSVLGLPLGAFFQRMIMQKIRVEHILYPPVIHPASYLLAFLLTMVFSLVIVGVVRGRLRKIPMAESLKAQE